MQDRPEDPAGAMWEWALSASQAGLLFSLIVGLCVGARLLGYP